MDSVLTDTGCFEMSDYQVTGINAYAPNTNSEREDSLAQIPNNYKENFVSCDVVSTLSPMVRSESFLDKAISSIIETLFPKKPVRTAKVFPAGTISF